jgi:conjugal transfer ATP-binding protein TraC
MISSTLFANHQALTYQRYDVEKKYYLNHGSVGCVFWCHPQVVMTDAGFHALTSFVNDVLPNDALLQCTLLSTPKIGDVLARWASQRQHAVLNILTEERRAFFAAHALTPPCPTENGLLCDVMVLVSITLPQRCGADLEVQRLASLWGSMTEVLGLSSQSVPPSLLLSVVSTLLHPDDSLHWRASSWQPHTPLNEQCLDPDSTLTVTKDSVHALPSDWAIKTYSVRQFPKTWSQNSMSTIVGDFFSSQKRLNAPFLWQLTLSTMPSLEAKRRALIKSARWQKLSQSVLRFCVPRAKAVADEWQMVLKRTDLGECLVKVCCQVAVLSPRETFLSATEQFETLTRQQDWLLVPNTYLHYPLYLTFLPMQVTPVWDDLKRLGRTQTLLSEQAVSLLPLQGEYKGSSSSCVLLTGRRGQVGFWDPFDNPYGNYNTAIIGKSRSGKSVFMQELASSVLAQGGQVFIIDVGRSFEKSCDYLGGTFMTFDRDDPQSLNPFTQMTSFDEALMMLKPVMAAMAAPKGNLGDVEASLLEQALKLTWEKHQQASDLTQVAQWLADHRDQRAKDCATLLYPFTQEGMYGAFFHGACQLDLSAPYIVLELDGLKGQRDCQTVVLMLLVYHITQALMAGDRHRRKLVIIDEAWDLLNGEFGGHFIETGCRRAAKYNGAFVTATQSRRDYDKTPAAQAALANSDWTIYFAQKPDAVEEAHDNTHRQQSQFFNQCLKSLTTKRDSYAECWIQGTHGGSVYRLWLDAFSRLLYSSRAEDHARIKALQAKGLSLKEAIFAVIAENAGGQG